MDRKTLICERSEGTASEIVLCDDRVSMDAHRELFGFKTEHYIICDSPPVECISGITSTVGKIHLSFPWRKILSIALWKDSFTFHDIFYLLKGVGLEDEDINPFRHGEVDDIFPALYYGKNFDALRRVCNLAKRITEEKLRQKGYKIVCHLVAEDVKRIVASSL